MPISHNILELNNWNGVYPYIQDALRYLSLTQQGKQIIANLYSNVFVVEHEKTEEEQRELLKQAHGTV
jgi:hypothetical protein